MRSRVVDPSVPTFVDRVPLFENLRFRYFEINRAPMPLISLTRCPTLFKVGVDRLLRVGIFVTLNACSV